MFARVALFLPLVLHGAAAAGTDPEVFGTFDPGYDGGADYYYDDPKIGSLDPIHFKHSPDMTCTANRRRDDFEDKYRGVNLGGHFVLEPWVTPSMFYQFLGADKRHGRAAPDHTAMDTYTFCKVLGAEEGNRQFKRHWAAWITEADFAKLHKYKVNAVRVPVGDWMFKPYGPYVNCTEGALEELKRVLDLAHKYGMKALLDLHGVRESQNGFDNSGMMHNLEWTEVPAWLTSGQVSFTHWAVLQPGWLGYFDRKQWRTTSIRWKNIDHTIDVLCEMTELFKDHPAVFGLQPLNEPWQETPIGPLKRFYWEAYKAMKRRAPHWKYIMSDSFRPDVGLWGGFMAGCPDTIISTHLHQAWMPAQPAINFMIASCEQKHLIAQLAESVMPVIVGEFALATDNCAMWLNGFNDNLPGYPMVECDYVPCAAPYMGADQPGAPPDPDLAEQGPFGTGMSTPRYGMCPIDKSWPNDDYVMRKLAHKKLNAYNAGSGWFFWNFKTELEPKWDYMASVENGWMPTDPQAEQDDIEFACNLEDIGAFKCQVKKGVPMGILTAQLNLACEPDEMKVPYCTGDLQYRMDHATDIFTQNWRLFHVTGGTCDFDGAAELVPDYTYEDDASGDDTDAAALPLTAAAEVPRLSGREEKTRLPLPLPSTAPAGAVCLVAVAALLAVVGRRAYTHSGHRSGASAGEEAVELSQGLAGSADGAYIRAA
mmetsp:Transcript_20251/g.64037  ORF Transcript_20251/g.64037 Transcript_20251/m.64037 type:complete len:708 (+) Transcript_20251:2-2125(+)